MLPPPLPLLLRSCLALGLALPAQESIHLPESSPARAWAAVGPETAPVELARELYGDEPWLATSEAHDPSLLWGRWSTWLREEGRREAIDPRRRAGLLSIAAGQGRWSAAWGHFERLGAEPGWAAALLPRLLPGVPAGHPTLPGGRPAPLATGVLLRPALPPPPAEDPPWSLRPRRAEVTGLVVGDSVLDFAISVEPSGVQVDLVHRSGPAVELRVLLPEPPGQEIRVEYVDWMRCDSLREPLLVEVLPGEEEHNLFGRFRPRRSPVPAVPNGGLPWGLERGGLWLEVRGEPSAEERALARALGELFELESGCRAPGETGPNPAWEGTRVSLPSGEAGLRRRLELASLAEAYVLAGGLRSR